MSGFTLGSCFGAGVVMIVSTIIGVSPRDMDSLQQQAFERGHMVQCVGKTGYYWECEE